MDAEEGNAASTPLWTAPSYGTVPQPSTPTVRAAATSASMESQDSQPGASLRSVTQEMDDNNPLSKMELVMPMPPEESVYSYLMFMPPIEQRREKRYVTNLLLFAVVLVIVNFVMQAGLLYVVGRHIMHLHAEWVGRITNIQHHAWYHVVPMTYNVAPPKCHGAGSPLCNDFGDGMSCTPMSIHALTDWDNLDTNGDGIWGRDEAEAADLIEKVHCAHNVDLPSLYDDMVTQINNSQVLQGRRDTRLLSGTGVHKAYLDWYLHKPLLCQYGDQDMCGALFERGFFDEALRQKSSPEFKDTKSAMKYCHDLLQYECFDILPSTYRVWRSVTTQQCGDKIFGQSLYKNPSDDREAAVPMLHVDFRKHREYASTKFWPFRLFLCILLTTFLSVMALELRCIFKSFIWCAKFPVDDTTSVTSARVVDSKAVLIVHNRSSARLESDDDCEDPKKTVLAIRWDHRLVVLIVTSMRLCLWCFLLWSGIMFLTGPPRYLTLIFDALSLLFIIEIDELLYTTMLRTEFKNDHMNTNSMQVPSWHGGIVSGRASVTSDIAGFFFVIAFAAIIVYTFTQNELNPLLESLECLCSVQGPKCYEANHYSKAYWDTYWSTTLPASNAIIDQLRLI